MCTHTQYVVQVAGAYATYCVPCTEEASAGAYVHSSRQIQSRFRHLGTQELVGYLN